MAGECTLAFTDSGFDREVLRSEVPVLVDFWGEGCPPCRQLAMRYHVRAIRPLLLFEDGQVVEQRVGARAKSYVKKTIDPHV